MVEERNIGRRNDDGIGAVGQLRALDDRDLIETVIRARCRRPNIVLLVLHIHVAGLRICGKFCRFIVALFRDTFLDGAPTLAVVGPGVFDPRVFCVYRAFITVIGIHDPALIEGVCCRTLINAAGDKARLIAGQADKVKAGTAEREFGCRPASVLRIGAAADGGLYGRAERIGGAGIISAVVAIDIVRVIVGELEAAGTVFALMCGLTLSSGLPTSVKDNKAVLIIDRCRRHDGNGAVAVPRVFIPLIHNCIGKGFRLIHHHPGLGVGYRAVIIDSCRTVGSIKRVYKPIQHRLGRAHIGRNVTADARKGNRTRCK